jgi:hypothetical protein
MIGCQQGSALSLPLGYDLDNGTMPIVYKGDTIFNNIELIRLFNVCMIRDIYIFDELLPMGHITCLK